MPVRCLASVLLLAALCAACSDSGSNDDAYRIETLVPGSPLHGANGITWGPDGMLYVGSVSSQTIYRVNPGTGQAEVVVPAPAGEADDVAFAPDGTMVWTALLGGEIRALREDGSVDIVVSDMALINPVYFTTDGRLFAAQVGFDRLYEFDFEGDTEPRLVASKIGNLNSFEITDDDELYGPLSNVETVARIDIESGEVTPVAENLGKVVAVNLDSDGNIWAVDWAGGRLWRIHPITGARAIVATLEPPLDNLAIGPDDTVYVSRPAHSAIETVDPETGEIQTLVDGNLSLPGGLAITSYNGREALVVADGYGYRLVDTETGAVTTPYDLTKFGFPSAATDLAVNHDFFVFSDLGIRPRVYLVDRTNFETVMTWTKIKMPYGMVLRDNGDPIVTDFATGTLIGLSRTDRKLRDVVADELDGPVGIAWAGPGIVYLTEALGGKLVRINLADGSKTLISSELSQPEGITVLTDGRVAVVEVGKQRLIAVDPVSGAIDVLATELPVGEPAARLPAPVHAPSGVAQSPDGSIYLTGDRDNSVLKLVNRNP
jgi:sugar lactone lactonase YvrE